MSLKEQLDAGNPQAEDWVPFVFEEAAHPGRERPRPGGPRRQLGRLVVRPPVRLVGSRRKAVSPPTPRPVLTYGAASYSTSYTAQRSQHHVVVLHPHTHDPLRLDFDSNGRRWLVHSRGNLTRRSRSGRLRPPTDGARHRSAARPRLRQLSLVGGGRLATGADEKRSVAYDRGERRRNRPGPGLPIRSGRRPGTRHSGATTRRSRPDPTSFGAAGGTGT